MAAFPRNLMNDIIVPFASSIRSFYRALPNRSGINERVSSRQGREGTGTTMVRNNVSSGRNCPRNISVSLSDNKTAAWYIRARRSQDALGASRDVRFPRQGEISGRPGRRQTIFQH